MSHGALFQLGAKTNSSYYHAVKQTTAAATGPRVSITFRRVLSYKTDSGDLIGQGASYASLNWPTELILASNRFVPQFSTISAISASFQRIKERNEEFPDTSFLPHRRSWFLAKTTPVMHHSPLREPKFLPLVYLQSKPANTSQYCPVNSAIPSISPYQYSILSVATRCNQQKHCSRLQYPP